MENSALAFPPAVQVADDATGVNWNAPVVAEPATASDALRDVTGAVVASSAHAASATDANDSASTVECFVWNMDSPEEWWFGDRYRPGATDSREREHPLVRRRFPQRSVAAVYRRRIRDAAHSS